MLRRAVLTSVLAVSSVTFAADKVKVSASDAKFIKQAAMGAMAEVDMGNLASKHAQSDAVKEFGQRLVTDHGKELAELKTLATSKNVELPDALDKSHQKMSDKMAKLPSEDFDKAFSKDMLADHQKDVKDFKKEAEKADDADVKAFASKQVPTLEEHLALAEKLPGNGENAAVAAREGHHSRSHEAPAK